MTNNYDDWLDHLIIDFRWSSSYRNTFTERKTCSMNISTNYTRSQAVAGIADRTASQHIFVSGHVTSCHFLLVVFWNQTSISNGFRDIQRQM